MTDKTNMTSYRYTISGGMAVNKGMPRTFIAIQTKETEKAVYLFGRGTTKNHTHCMACGRILTHDISRFLGIGPICSRHMYGYNLSEENKNVLAKMIQETKIDTWFPKSVILKKEKTDEVINFKIKEFQSIQETESWKKAILENGKIKITFRFDWDTIALIKTLSGRRYNKNGGYWTALKSFDTVESLINWGFDLSNELKNWYTDNTKTISGSDLIIPGLQKELRPYQKDGVAYIQSRKGRALIGDEMGLGKTAQALAWLQLNQEKAMPALVICPASLKLNWLKEVKIWMDDPKVAVLSGGPKKGVSTWKKSDIIIINYDIISKWKNELKKNKSSNYNNGRDSLY